MSAKRFYPILLAIVMMVYGLCGFILPSHACCQEMAVSCHGMQNDSDASSQPEFRDCCVKPVTHEVTVKRWSASDNPLTLIPQPLSLASTNLLSQYWESLNQGYLISLTRTAWLRDQSNRHLELSVLLN